MTVKILDSFVDHGPTTRFIDDEGKPVYAHCYFPVVKTDGGTYLYKTPFEWAWEAQELLYDLLDHGLKDLSKWILHPVENDDKSTGLTPKTASSKIKKSVLETVK